MRNQTGFTLMELMIVVAIIGIISMYYSAQAATLAAYCVDYSTNEQSLFFNDTDDCIEIKLGQYYLNDNLMFKVTQFADKGEIKFKIRNAPSTIQPYFSYDRVHWYRVENKIYKWANYQFSICSEHPKVFIALNNPNNNISEKDIIIRNLFPFLD